MTGRDLEAVAVWLAVSGVTLTAVEALLLASRGSTYTDTYQAVRNGHCAVSWLPVAAAAVVIAHLEGVIPPRLDPFTYAGKIARKILP